MLILYRSPRASDLPVLLHPGPYVDFIEYAPVILTVLFDVIFEAIVIDKPLKLLDV